MGMVSCPQVSANQWIMPDPKSAAITPSIQTRRLAGWDMISGRHRTIRRISRTNAATIDVVSRTRVDVENSS